MKGLRERLLHYRVHALSSAAALLALCGCATPHAPPPTANESLPANIQANQNEVLQEVMTTHGDETYRCQRVRDTIASVTTPPEPGTTTDGTQLQWLEAGSEATLVDAGGDSIGTVTPGHYFVAYDGSYVIGKPFAESQVDANTLTWARYTAKFVAAPRPGEGRFANVSSIQRIDTKGGLPPQIGCTLEGSQLLVPYAATYMIYRAKGRAAIASTASTPVTAASTIRTTSVAAAPSR